MCSVQSEPETRTAANSIPHASTPSHPRRLLGVVMAAAAGAITIPLLTSPAAAGPVPVALPVVASGTVVDTSTGAPVAGAQVTYSEVGSHASRRTVTDRLGRYRIAGLGGEEYAIHIRGPRPYEVGFVGCPVTRILPIIKWTYPVVPTWGAACSQSPRAMGRIGLDRRF